MENTSVRILETDRCAEMSSRISRQRSVGEGQEENEEVGEDDGRNRSERNAATRQGSSTSQHTQAHSSPRLSPKHSHALRLSPTCSICLRRVVLIHVAKIQARPPRHAMLCVRLVSARNSIVLCRVQKKRAPAPIASHDSKIHYPPAHAPAG